jgi:ribonuclease J
MPQFFRRPDSEPEDGSSESSARQPVQRTEEKSSTTLAAKSSGPRPKAQPRERSPRSASSRSYENQSPIRPRRVTGPNNKPLPRELLPTTNALHPLPMGNVATFNSNGPILKVLPLGGNGTVTQNCFVYQYGDDILVVDCGMGFPSEDLLGVDIVLPDITYLRDKVKQIRGMIITHGHEDHIGAVPYLAPKLNVPIYATQFVIELLKYKLNQVNVKQELITIDPSKEFQIGPFKIQPFRVNHSIPDCVGFIIKTPNGTVIHTGDYKYDWTSVDGTIIEVDKMATAGQAGVLCLMSDCLRIEKPGMTPSEAVIEDRLEAEMRKATGRIFLTTISSNVTRIQQAINVAMRHGRKTAFAGRSIENIADIAMRLGYLHIPDGVVVRDTAIGDLPDNQQLIILTGAMGQDGSALMRLTEGEHKLFHLKEGDLIIFSADPIPGSEDRVYGLIDDLTKQGAKIAYSDIANNLHVSGHAAAEELKLTVALTKPRYVMPISGMSRMLKAYGQMAQSMGYPEENIFVVEAGQEVLFDNDGHAKLGIKHPYNGVLVDGLGVGDVGEVIIADRQQLSESGVFVVTARLKNKELVGDIDLQTRGFVYAKANERLMGEARQIARTVLTDPQTKSQEFAMIRSRLQDRLSKHFKTQMDRTPIVMPVLLDVS